MRPTLGSAVTAVCFAAATSLTLSTASKGVRVVRLVLGLGVAPVCSGAGTPLTLSAASNASKGLRR